MPECLDCGNNEVFYFDVKGQEEQLFDENGVLRSVEEQWLDYTGGPYCSECDSTNMEDNR